MMNLWRDNEEHNKNEDERKHTMKRMKIGKRRM